MTYKQPLTITLLSAEVNPYFKTGGLGDVARSLAVALSKQGHTVRIITIKHAATSHKKFTPTATDLSITHKHTTLNFSVYRDTIDPNISVYFIDEPTLLNASKQAYNTGKDGVRFFIFCAASLQALKALNLHSDIISCHDWHTGLAPYLLTTAYKNDLFFAATKSCFTIHNLTFQSATNWWEIPPQYKDTGRTSLPEINNTHAFEYINFVRRALHHSDAITAVSEQYAKEILTTEHGQGLERVLKNNTNKLVGIINGIDYAVWNPKTDPGLIQNYDHTELEKKEQNKLWFQKKLGLKQDVHIPLIGWSHRLAEQKGIELLIEVMEPLLRLNIQIVLLGAGEKKYEDFFDHLSKQHPHKLVTNRNYIKTKISSYQFDNQEETRLLAASDLFIQPSRFEPCGIGQLKSLRYGAIPIVHKVGGLADTIQNYHTREQTGNGFVFETYDSRDMLIALTRAIENFKHYTVWQQLVAHAMQQSFSWDIPASTYTEVFYHTLDS